MSQQNLSEGCNQPSSVQDSHASRIRVQENAVHLVMSVTSGRKCGESFAKLNPDGFWVKTSRGSVQARMDNSSEEYCETWPRWGIMSGGVAGRLRMLERHTTENGSLLLPTCAARDYKDTGQNTNYRKLSEKCKLSGRIAMLPTVTTPRPHDSEKTAGEYIPSQNQVDLTVILGKNNGLKLQPAFAEWMMGFPQGWTALSASEMPSSRSKSTRSSKRSQSRQVATMDDDENNTRYLTVAKILKEQQNQFIITEEMIIKCRLDSHVLPDSLDRIAGDEIRSHPYQSERYCLWIEDDDGVYQTSCLHSFEIMNGTPETNGIKFCPYCGKLIRQVGSP